MESYLLGHGTGLTLLHAWPANHILKLTWTLNCKGPVFPMQNCDFSISPLSGGCLLLAHPPASGTGSLHFLPMGYMAISLTVQELGSPDQCACLGCPWPAGIVFDSSGQGLRSGASDDPFPTQFHVCAGCINSTVTRTAGEGSIGLKGLVKLGAQSCYGEETEENYARVFHLFWDPIVETKAEKKSAQATLLPACCCVPLGF